jgi:phage I-like protein
VGQEGFDPKSEEYYSEIDKRMKNEFPHKFSQNEAGVNDTSADDRPVQAVASANRSSSKNARSKTVRLTPSQVAIAKKLGVPLTEYAKYVNKGGQA